MNASDDANVSREPAELDGNAAAGLLQQIFAIDITLAQITCGSCELVQPLAALRLYGLPMGNILCCRRCQATLIRAVARDQECWLDLRGAAALHARLA
jgi:Family of unknown function (DUF6510)